MAGVLYSRPIVAKRRRQISEASTRFFHPTKKTRVVPSAFVFLIFSQSLNTVIVPDDWRAREIAPIFKKGDKSFPLY